MEDDVSASNFVKNSGRQIKRAGIIAGLCTVVAFGAIGCGGGNEPGATVAEAPEETTSAGAGPAPSGNANPLAYAQCMRQNGVANFPDPAKDGSVKFGGKDGIDPNSSEFKAADAKCKQFLPGGEKNQNPGVDPWSAELKLQYANCMRSNGVPSFPDPDADGRFPQLEKGGPVDPDSAQFKKADTACAQYKPQNLGTNGGPQGGQAK
jgi:hypothetical protein